MYYNLTKKHVAHKSLTTLQRLLTNIKDKDEPKNRQGVVYKTKSATAWILTLVKLAET